MNAKFRLRSCLGLSRSSLGVVLKSRRIDFDLVLLMMLKFCFLVGLLFVFLCFDLDVEATVLVVVLLVLVRVVRWLSFLLWLLSTRKGEISTLAPVLAVTVCSSNDERGDCSGECTCPCGCTGISTTLRGTDK